MPDERGRYVNTAEFLRPAERYQLMPQIDRWVVNSTLAAITAGQIKLPGNRSCAINLSGQTLGDEGFLGYCEIQFSRFSKFDLIRLEWTWRTFIRHVIKETMRIFGVNTVAETTLILGRYDTSPQELMHLLTPTTPIKESP